MCRTDIEIDASESDPCAIGLQSNMGRFFFLFVCMYVGFIFAFFHNKVKVEREEREKERERESWGKGRLPKSLFFRPNEQARVTHLIAHFFFFFFF